ncbi:MAG: PGRS family protein [Acidobacteria bacterium]|nr:PGRS family protein [Acidobacteriota bacterium]
MRVIRYIGLGGFAAASTVAACSNDSEDCEVFNTCGGTTSTTGTAGSGGSVDPGCVPSDLPANTPLPDTCAGVFVSGTNGNDGTGDGTRGNPYASVATALAGGAAVVYACSGQTADTATVQVPAGSNLFGGLDCADWHYTGDKTAITTTAPIAMVLEGGAAASSIEDFAITAANGGVAGESSIAVLSDGATAVIERCELTAGDGMNGQAGTSLLHDNAMDGAPGSPGAWEASSTCALAAQSYFGGDGGAKTCGGVVVDGGKGADGNDSQGGDAGAEGLPNGFGTSGDGGQGQPSGAGSCADQPAQSGHSGAAGTDFSGATGVGTLSPTGYLGTSGVAGDPGEHGQGGGGGGGAHECQLNSLLAGPSGGGGGSGACGGAGGGAGTGAGASIALAAVGGSITLTDCSLATGIGGIGGAGGNGQPGGLAAFQVASGGGPGACAGAQGGNGGPGGSGGGGLGGHSVGVAKASAATVTLTNATFTIGTAGQGGPGGDSKPALDGADGLRCSELDFGTSSCTPAT